MTLEEAIKHVEEVASRCEFDTDWGMANHFIDRSGVADVIKCGEEHRQLAEWLKELRDYKEQRLPSAQPEPSQIARDIATIIENERDMRVIERNAESERKKGKWIYSDDDDPLYDSYFCSCCHRYITVDAERKCDIGFIIDDFDFCPYCGSYNKGDDNVCNKE